MKYLIILALTFAGATGFCHSESKNQTDQVKSKKVTVKKNSRSPASAESEEAEPDDETVRIAFAVMMARPVVTDSDRELYQALRPNEFMPDCRSLETGRVLYSDGSCRPRPVERESNQRIDTRRVDFCYHVIEAASRVYSSNALMAEAQQMYNRWEDNLWENVQRANSSHPGAPRYSACRDCGVCDDGESDNGGWSFSISRNVNKPYDPSRQPMPGIDDPEEFRRRFEGRPSNIPRGRKVPGIRIRFRF